MWGRREGKCGQEDGKINASCGIINSKCLLKCQQSYFSHSFHFLLLGSDDVENQIKSFKKSLKSFRVIYFRNPTQAERLVN